MKKLKCPVCKSENTKDCSKYEDNGVVGSGYQRWKVLDQYVCNDCGVYFKRV